MAEQQFAPSTTSAPTIPAITLNGVEVDFPNSDTSFSVKDLDSISKSPKLTVGGTSSQVVKLEPRTSDEKREREKVRHEDVAEKSVQDPERGRHIQTEQRNRQRRHSVHDVSREPLPSPSFGSLTKDVPKRQMPPTRQSASSKIPSLRIIDKTSEGGWRVKIRTMFSPRPVSRINVDIILVYVYSTSMENARGTDADTTLFTHRGESNKTASTPIPSIQRARTAQVPDTRRSRSSPFAPTLDTSKSTLLPTSIKDLPTRNVRRQHPSPERPTSKESQRPRNQVSWLSSPDMLPKQFPRGRVTTVGLDLSTAASTPLDFESAANQFLNCVAEIRKEKSQTPVLLLGHTYGGILIIQSLVKIAQQGSDARLLLEKVAGVFLFSCTHIHSTKYSQLLADLLNEKPTAGVFSSVVDGMPNLARLAQTFRTTIFQSRYTSRAKHPNPSERGPETDFEEIKLAFPIVQFVTNAEKPDPQKPPKDSSTDFLKLPTRTITLEKDFSNALLFTASTDSDFLRLMLLMHSGLRTHQFLYTVVNDGYREVQKMIRDGYNVNIRDRWNQSALHIAVRRNNDAMVRLLLRAGKADPNIRDASLNTPLHYAVDNDNANIVGELLERGADINCENDRKQKPKDLVAAGSSRKRIAKMLKSQLIDGPDRSDTNMRLSNNNLPSSHGGRLACKNYQITVTELFASEGQDKHWTVSVSVQELLYSDLSLEEILQAVRPDSVRDKSPFCVWIHIPENNMIWVEDLFVKLCIHPAIWQGRRGISGDSLRNRAITPHVRTGDTTSLFVPYLSYEANARQAKRHEFVQLVDKVHQQEALNRQIVAQHIPQPSIYGYGNGPPSLQTTDSERTLLSVPETLHHDDGRGSLSLRDGITIGSEFESEIEGLDEHDLDEEEKGLIEEYLHSPASLHIRRTLDQYYYHMLSNTDKRDVDQVVSRWACRIKDEPVHNILMVDQLWLWKANSDVTYDPTGALGATRNNRKCDYIVSCFPGRAGAGDSTQQRWVDNLRHAVLLPRNKQRDPILQSRELVSRILTTCFDGFDRLQSAESVRFFNIFEDTIGAIDDRETVLFQNFQEGSQQRHNLDKTYKHFDRKKQELLEQLLDIREETELLVEVKDIRDEINIILSVLRVQQSLVTQLQGPTVHPDARLPDSSVESLILANISDFEKLDSQAKTTQDNLNTLMDLKQKAANAWEAREAREIALQTGRQGNTMLVFTVVTIIFLPLSFTSTFFAIGISAFPKDPRTGETNWPLGLIAGLIFGISLSLSIPLIVFAMNMQIFTAIWRDIRHDHLLHIAIIFLGKLPQSHQVAVWIRWLEQHRDAYLNDYVVGEERKGTDQSVEHENDALTLMTTLGSSDSPIEVGSDNARKSSLLARFRSRKFDGIPNRIHRDEEALREGGDSHHGE